MDHITTPQRGASLIEVILGVSVMLIVFGGFFALLQASLALGERNHIWTDALHLADEHIETLRALPYDAIGTVGGLPSGTIPQTESVTFDGRTYTRRTFIQYVDDTADGTDAADTLTADYKRIKVDISYNYHNATQTCSMVTTIAPKSQESLAGAGVLRVNVIDADNDPVGLANVHIINTTVATSVDITTFTNASGTISFPGAWAGTGYEVTVGKAGYSSAQTYTASVANPNPSPSPLTVAVNSTTAVYFKIDRLSTIAFRARQVPVRSEFADTFADASGLSELTGVVVGGGAVLLAGSPGTYGASGTARSIPFTPAALEAWVMLAATATKPPGTDIRYTIEYDAGGGVFTPVPEGDLAGNAAGFTTPPIALGGLATTTYGTLRIAATLSSSDPLVTPTIERWYLSYEGPTVPVAGAQVSLQGFKTIGTDSGGDQIHKYDVTHTTDTHGMIDLTSMEFDEYTVGVAGYTVAEACPALPLVLEPNSTYTQTLTLAAPSAHSYQVQVLHPLGGTVSGAEVHLAGGAVDTIHITGPCGTAFFSGLTADTYTVSIQAPGLAATTTARAVNGATSDAIALTL